jgi:hypothetical protein
MGRYTTVQTYTDQDAKVAAISYSTATTTGGDAAPPASAAAPEATEDRGQAADEGGRFHINRVDNVAGSTAGAGSGEFHMYRASRRREMERVAHMEKQHEAKKLQEEFEHSRKRKAQEFETRANKRADKRRRRKERQKTRELETHSSEDKDEDEDKDKDNKDKDQDKGEEKGEPVRETPGGVPAIPNDGSFLAKMLALQEQGGKEEKESKPSKRR